MIPVRPQRLQVGLTAVLSLGSNLGDREATIRQAVQAIGGIRGVTLVSASALVETPALKPEGVDHDAPAYLNAVVVVRTVLSPQQLLDATSAIEQQNGRVREERWGDRTLDIDIVDFGGFTLLTDTLTLPHPRAASRAFVLAPWAQVAPDAVLPGLGRIDALLEGLTDEVVPYPGEPLL